VVIGLELRQTLLRLNFLQIKGAEIALALMPLWPLNPQMEVVFKLMLRFPELEMLSLR